MKPTTVLAGILLMAALLSGCHAPDDGDGTPPPGDGNGMDDGDGNGMDDGDGNGEPEAPLEITLTPVDPPAVVLAGQAFNLTVTVEASRAATSEHSGSHWGFNSSAGADPSQYTTFLTDVSPHVLNETHYPGSYTITGWTFSEDDVGRTVYYRAHTLIEDQHFWGEELSFLIGPAT